MRHFHKQKNHYHCPTVNLDRLWTLVPTEVREKHAKAEVAAKGVVPVIDVTKSVSGYAHTPAAAAATVLPRSREMCETATGRPVVAVVVRGGGGGCWRSVTQSSLLMLLLRVTASEESTMSRQYTQCDSAKTTGADSLFRVVM